MNKKLQIFSIVLITTGLIILTACAEKEVENKIEDNIGSSNKISNKLDNNQNSKSNGDNNEIEISNPKNENNEILKDLLPNQTGFRWVYNGFAEYGNILELKRINYEAPDYQYILEGEVEDMSDGESKLDFSVKLQYLLKNGELVQIKEEEIMMDSIFDNLIIIKAPLKVGNTWIQRAVDKEGNHLEVKGTITKIELENGKRVYDIKYEYGDDSLFEFRRIKEGVGTVQFQKPFISDGNTFEIGYSLNEEGSGYDK
ncbi:hypothetical protein SH2C18_43040 [Clostridium sediminicola]|uniref:hypothetical protein n=1 Tax=Clostridium sediminicola TaxID=3114879 RepID=UPI0031F25EB0